MPRSLPGKIILSLYSCLLFIFLPGSTASSQTFSGNSCDQPEYNLVLIVINSLRADHLGSQGYPRATSPHIDTLAKESVYFDRAFAQSYWTLPSLATIFTSKYLCAHKLNERDKSLGLNQKTFTLALKEHGYLTDAFTCGLDAAALYGLGKSFDSYDVYGGSNPMGVFADMLPKVFRKLSENKNKKFFLFLHSYDTHPPYRYDQRESFDKGYKGIFTSLPMDYNSFKALKNHTLGQGNNQAYVSDRDLNHIVACYDDALKQADSFIGSLIAELKALKLYEKTVIILCADHGEELGERGTFNRFGNQNLYQEVVRVPLIIRYPGLSQRLQGRRIRSLVGLVDIAPTVLDLLGIPNTDSDFQGESLRRFVETTSDKEGRKFIVSEASKAKWMLLRSDGWKLVHSAGKNELYDLNNDPGEQINLAAQNPQMLVIMLQDFFSWRQAHCNEEKTNNRVEFDQNLIDRLRKAGYW